MAYTTANRLAKLFTKAFGEENGKLAVAAIISEKPLDRSAPPKALAAYRVMRLLNYKGKVSNLINQNRASFATAVPKQVYNKELLGLMTNRIHDMPDVVVLREEKIRVNVLVPAFSIKSISAGFFGVFNVALFLSDLGYSVRLVLFDNFYYNEAEFKSSLSEFPAFSDLFERVEVSYIGSRAEPLAISPYDRTVATVWYSAYFAEKIQGGTNLNRFVYLVQDYESAFYPSSAMSAFADNSYCLRYDALVSTAPLLEYMREQKRFSADVRAEYFNNSCSVIMPPWPEFQQLKISQPKKKFVFYSRPAVNRNMFEMAALAVIVAYEAGVFPRDEWEFYGIGLGEAEVRLDATTAIHQLPRMSLAEYERSICSFDVCLSLMASPHPSIVPFDLAGAGAIVVTNSFGPKNAEYFKQYSDNIIVSAPELNGLVSAMQTAVKRSSDLRQRHIDAESMSFPTSWNEVWERRHEAFFRECFKPEVI